MFFQISACWKKLLLCPFYLKSVHNFSLLFPRLCPNPQHHTIDLTMFVTSFVITAPSLSLRWFLHLHCFYVSCCMPALLAYPLSHTHNFCPICTYSKPRQWSKCMKRHLTYNELLHFKLLIRHYLFPDQEYSSLP